MKKLDNEVGYLASAVSMEELNTFRDIQVIYVQQETTMVVIILMNTFVLY